jgi:hypothetical protein
MRPVTEPPAKAATEVEGPARQAGQPPKPGMTSCAGKFEGRYASAAGGPGVTTIVFRSGKATLREPDVVVTNGQFGGVTDYR